MGTIHAPFASHDYDDTTHAKDIVEVPSGQIAQILVGKIDTVEAGYIEPVADGKTRITTIRKI